MYNIVTNHYVINEIKKCRYFKHNLGMASTIDIGNGNRILSDKDRFAFLYNSQYKTTIYAHGNIGDIKFYIDMYINDAILAVYVGEDNEEFIFNFDDKMVNEKGIDFYIGYILKELDFRIEERKNTDTQKRLEMSIKKSGNPDLLSISPGSVTYDDIKAFIENKNKNLYINN